MSNLVTTSTRRTRTRLRGRYSGAWKALPIESVGANAPPHEYFRRSSERRSSAGGAGAPTGETVRHSESGGAEGDRAVVLCSIVSIEHWHDHPFQSALPRGHS